MSRYIFFISVLLLSIYAQAHMSEIDLEVREAIAYELDENPDDVHSLRFIETESGCIFMIEAKVVNNSCKVCFKKNLERHYISDVICERLSHESEQ